MFRDLARPLLSVCPERTERDMRPPDLTLPTRRRYARGVRATLTIDDDVLEAASYIADDEGVTVGDVISRLARSGLEPRTRDRQRTRLPAFTVAPSSRPTAPWMGTGRLDD